MKTNGTRDLTYNQRLQLSEYLQMNIHKKLIAQRLNCCLATIYREIERGMVNGTYDPDYAQKKYDALKIVRGKPEKLLIDTALAQQISDLILRENLSLEKAVKKLKEQNITCPTKTTIYAAINKGLIPNVTRKDLHNKTTTMFSRGLIQIPMWIRDTLKLQDGDSLTISLRDNAIILEKISKV